MLVPGIGVLSMEMARVPVTDGVIVLMTTDTAGIVAFVVRSHGQGVAIGREGGGSVKSVATATIRALQPVFGFTRHARSAKAQCLYRIGASALEELPPPPQVTSSSESVRMIRCRGFMVLPPSSGICGERRSVAGVGQPADRPCANRV